MNEKDGTFFDATLDKLEAFRTLADAAIRCLHDGEFQTAVAMMDEGCCLTDDSVWESTMRDVETLRDIAEKE